MELFGDGKTIETGLKDTSMSYAQTYNRLSFFLYIVKYIFCILVFRLIYS